jgi:hypothetical protein
MGANYSDRKEPPKPPVESVAGYKQGQSPRAARFGQGGARNIAEIAEATEARRRHNEALSKRDIGPRSSGNRDSK